MKANEIGAIKGELEKISAKSPSGLLYPEDVVESARNNKSVLHKYFEWDNEKAGEQFRLFQARTLIRSIKIVDASEDPVPMYLSLKNDRYENGGYRNTADVISSTELRDQLMRTAEWELSAWTKRNRGLRDLLTREEWVDLVLTSTEAKEVPITLTNSAVA